MNNKILNEIETLVSKLETTDELKIVQNLLNSQNLIIQYKAKQVFKVGDKVAFVDGLKRYEGTVIQFCRKNIKVLVPKGQEWTVSPTLLTKVN